MDIKIIPAQSQSESVKKPYLYAIIRRDLSEEQKLVQLGHAAYHAGQEFKDTEIIPSFITLAIDNQEELLEASARLTRYGIKHTMFYEPDFGPMGYSALCTEPLTTSKQRKIMWKYSTYKAAALAA